MPKKDPENWKSRTQTEYELPVRCGYLCHTKLFKWLTGLVLFVRNLTVLKSWTLGITSSLVFSLLRTPFLTTSGVRNRFRINKARNLNFSFFIQTKIKGTRFCFGVEYKNRVVLSQGTHLSFIFYASEGSRTRIPQTKHAAQLFKNEWVSGSLILNELTP